MPPKYAEFSSLILKSAGHLLQLINDILDLAKVESGKIDLKPERVQPRRRRRGRHVDRRRARAAARHPHRDDRRARHRRCAPRSEPAQAGALQLPVERHQVLTRTRPRRSAGPPPTARTTSASKSRTGASASRQDDLNRLFIEFQQLDASTAKHHKGTGLGLALTKRIVEAQGGSVGVRTEFGVGSTFFATAAERRDRAHSRRDVERSANERECRALAPSACG